MTDSVELSIDVLSMEDEYTRVFGRSDQLWQRDLREIGVWFRKPFDSIKNAIPATRIGRRYGNGRWQPPYPVLG